LGAYLCISAYGADGVALYTSASFVEPTKEASALTTAEMKQLAKYRSLKYRKSVTVVILNVAALDGKSVTVATPEGEEMTFLGSQKLDEGGKSHSWNGKSASRFPNGDATFTWRGDLRSLYGMFRKDGKVYEVGRLGQFGTVAELEVFPLREPY